MTTEYVWPVRAVKVDERSRIVSGIKTEAGQVEHVVEDMGWFIALDIGIALGTHNKPVIVAGDELELVLRKRERESSNEPPLEPVANNGSAGAAEAVPDQRLADDPSGAAVALKTGD